MDFGLTSHTLESLQIDEAVDLVNDFRSKITSATSEENAEVKAQKMLKVNEVELPYLLERFNKMTSTGYFVNGKLSLADLYFAGLLNYLNYRIGYTLIEKYPNLQKVVENVENEPKIKKYIAKRPVTEF